MNGSEVTACTEFLYLGPIASSNGKNQKDINSKIIQSKQAIQKFNSLWWSEQLNRAKKNSSIVKASKLMNRRPGKLNKRIGNGYLRW